MKQEPTTKELYLRLLSYIKPYWKTVIFMLIALVITAATQPLMPALLKPLIDDSMIKQDMDAIIMVPLLIVLVFIVKGISEYFSNILSEWVAQKAILDIRQEMFKKINNLPLETLQNYTSGKLISKISYDVAQVGSTLSDAWVIVIRDILIIIALLGFLFYTSWQLTLLILIVGPILGVIINSAGKMMRGSSTEMQNNMGGMTQVLEETISANKDIKIYNSNAYEENKFFHVAEDFRENSMKIAKVSAINTPLVQILAAIALSAVIYFISLMNKDGMFSPGEFVAFIVATAMIFSPIRRLTNINETIQKGMAAASSIFELLDQADEVDLGQQVITKPTGKIDFKQVTFQYKTAEHPILSKLSFTIEAHTTVALVGESGSGKTTIANLISRFFIPSKGKILFDEIDLESIKLVDLRSHIAHVSQDVTLFNDSIKANIAYGHTEFNKTQIIAAAKAAYAWDFIEKLPQGLETNIGDDGSKLSGGQRQRIAIARAFLKNAPILILDEATSALDNESEAKIQAALLELRKNRTVIIIAHRLSTIESADNIIVLKKGQIIETGSHQELISNAGYYKDLYQHGLK